MIRSLHLAQHGAIETLPGASYLLFVSIYRCTKKRHLVKSELSYKAARLGTFLTQSRVGICVDEVSDTLLWSTWTVVTSLSHLSAAAWDSGSAWVTFSSCVLPVCCNVPPKREKREIHSQRERWGLFFNQKLESG